VPQHPRNDLRVQIAWQLRTHSILGVTHRYPEAPVKVTGFNAAITNFGGS